MLQRITEVHFGVGYAKTPFFQDAGLLEFTMFASHDIAKLVGTAIAVAALSLGAPGSAAADAKDDAFLRTLNTDALLFDNAPIIIQKAQLVCEAFSAGTSPEKTNEQMLHGLPMSPRQVAIFMGRAVQFYCPQYADQFIR